MCDANQVLHATNLVSSRNMVEVRNERVKKE